LKKRHNKQTLQRGDIQKLTGSKGLKEEKPEGDGTLDDEDGGKNDGDRPNGEDSENTNKH